MVQCRTFWTSLMLLITFFHFLNSSLYMAEVKLYTNTSDLIQKKSDSILKFLTVLSLIVSPTYSTLLLILDMCHVYSCQLLNCLFCSAAPRPSVKWKSRSSGKLKTSTSASWDKKACKANYKLSASIHTVKQNNNNKKTPYCHSTTQMKKKTELMAVHGREIYQWHMDLAVRRNVSQLNMNYLQTFKSFLFYEDTEYVKWLWKLFVVQKVHCCPVNCTFIDCCVKV